MKKAVLLLLVVVLLSACSKEESVTVIMPSYGNNATTLSTYENENSHNPNSIITTTANPLSPVEVAAGLTPEMKEYIYGWGELAGYDFLSYMKAFDGQTNDFDLNGDGEKEKIELVGKDIEFEEGNQKYYNALDIYINKKKLTISAEVGYYFCNNNEGMPGIVYDIYKDDTKKELFVIMYSYPYFVFMLEYVIKYDNGDPQVIGKVNNNGINPKFVNGTGFMVAFDKIGETNTYGFKIIKLKDDRSGFIEVPLPLYKTEYTAYEGTTRFNVMLAAKPGEASDIELAKGTSVLVGYFDPKDYIEIRKGEETIGWLNLEGRGIGYLNGLFDDILGSTTDIPIETTSEETTSEEAVPLHSGDILAFLDSGLQKRVNMPEMLEQYYYLLSYPDLQEDNPNCIWFESSISADLDGDGQKESISLIEENGIGMLDINGNQLKVDIDDGFGSLSYGAYLLDIDINDGKKEICIPGDIWTYELGAIITYDGKEPVMIFQDCFEPMDIAVSGNGTIQIWKDRLYRELYSLNEDRSGFEKVDTEYYTSYYLLYYWENYGRQGSASETEVAIKLADIPGGKRNISIPIGTKVHFGLCSKDNWLMVMDSEGKLIGWLPAGEEVDLVPAYYYMPDGYGCID